MIKYLNGTRKDKLVLLANNPHVIKWCVDAFFSVHHNFKSHTGGFITLGGGSIQYISHKQNLNTQSITEAKPVGANNVYTLIIRTRFSLEDQGYDIYNNILCQDNRSTNILEKNGKNSSSKRTRSLKIHYFFMTETFRRSNCPLNIFPLWILLVTSCQNPYK